MDSCRFPAQERPFFYRHTWLAIVLMLVGLGLFAVAAYSVATKSLLYPSDQALSVTFKAMRDRMPDGLITALIWLANIASIGPNVICLYFCWRWLRAKCDDRFTLILSSYAVGLLLFWLFALAFDRPRPDLPGLLKSLPFPSFPSGHMIQTITLLAPLLYLFLPGVRKQGGRTAGILAAMAYTLLIGYNRLILDAHYLTDVLGGIGLGLFWTVFVLFSFEYYHLRQMQQSKQRVRLNLG